MWRRRDVLVAGSALLAARCRSAEERASLGVEPFLDEDDQAVGTLEGTGLDGRLAYDHSGLTADDLVTPTDAFFVRTREPMGLVTEGWEVELPNGSVSVDSLERDAEDQGVVLLECSGNGRNRHFGLISAATWSGVRLHDLITLEDDPLVEVVGLDDHAPPETNSVIGASWIFRWSDLADAFLAVTMNGESLTRDHGAPVRLVVPGWYGCANIKWVQTIRVVGETEAATSQMQEFALRTHQDGVPLVAARYRPARAEASAMVIRVERFDDDTVDFVGIAWGERSGQLTLHIEDQTFDAGQMVGPSASWEIWTVTVPTDALPRGIVDMYLTAAANVPQIRLDQRTYARTVRL